MKMRELAAACGLPKTTIHFYQREGLLPVPEKSARNSAAYGPVHLERLLLIGQLRAAGLPLLHLRRAIALVEQGVTIDTAIALQQALNLNQDGQDLDLAALAQAAGVEPDSVAADLRAGLLGAPERTRFGQADLAALQAICAMRAQGGSSAFLVRVMGGLHAVVREELALADTLTAGMAQAERSDTVLALQEAVDCLHPYWLAQARRHEVFLRWPPALQKLIKEQE